MIAFIIAGGKGTRLSSITNDEVPKPMAEIAGKPILLHALLSLKSYGITEFFFSVNHLKEKIEDFFGNGERFGVKISYIYEDVPLGSGGALYYVKSLIKDDFIMCSGDLVFNIDIDKMLSFHKNNNADITMLTHPNLHPFDSDLVVTNKDNRVVKFDFKNNVRNYYYKNNVNAGFFIINPKTLDYFDEPKKISMEHDFIANLIETNKRVFAYKSPEYIKDAGTPERFYSIEKEIESGLVNKKCLSQKQKAIFLDRDGVINVYKGFITNAEQIELTKTAKQAIKKINQSEYLAIVISNQPVIARGESTFEEVENTFNKIETLLSEEGAFLDGIYYCPHHPHKGFDGEVKELKIDCNCRKPKIGMIEKAVKDFNLDLSKCYMIGDSNVDVLTGKNAGIPQIKVKSDLIEDNIEQPTFYADDILSAVNLIIK